MPRKLGSINEYERYVKMTAEKASTLVTNPILTANVMFISILNY